ncbi:MAG TPA: methionine--tRNA ligase [bacterium]|nr:methionine--tRNA ligase [bacterium]
MATYYITTPIYYVNGEPHIGHAYTTIAADVAARFKRLAGYDVFFLTGTDEHGVNIARVAERNGVSPQQWCDRIAGEFQALWRRLNISNDDFIRTTEPRHARVVQAIFTRLFETGDIYKGIYEGWYCAPCESYYAETELGPGRTCPIHTNRPVEWTSEESYLFRLSKYRDWLLEYIEARPHVLQPEGPRSEVLSLLRSGLKDIAVSRTTFTWGIPVPFDPKHVIYVWIDALTNYITAAGYLDNPERFARYWPADVHLVGKEIVRFHAVIWPIILHAAKIPVPKQTFAHGWLTFGGQKFSKSLGTVLDPYALAQEIAAESGAEVDVAIDAIRYFLLREIPFGSDGDFSKPALIHRFNADLANDYGNLLNRTLPLVERHFDGRVSAPGPEAGGDAILRETAAAVVGRLDGLIDRLDFRAALETIWEILGAANAYLDREAPWREIGAGNTERAGTILYNTLEAARVATVLLSPWLPTATQRAWEQLGLDGSPASQRLAQAAQWGGLQAGTRVRPGQPIFPRIETTPAAKGQAVARSAPALKAKAAGDGDVTTRGNVVSQISIDEFKKVELRIAEILEAKVVAGADKLLELRIKIGDETRTLAAGIAQHYRPADLVGRKIVVVANLQPRKVRGVESQGMLLAASHGDQVILLTPEKDVPSGAPVS